MRPVALLALVLCALVAVADAGGIYVPSAPDSEYPAWLDGGTIRFQSNFEFAHTHDYAPVTYVMAADGTGVRPATDSEAHRAPESPPAGERLVFGAAPPGTAGNAPLFLVDAQGHRGLIEASAWSLGEATLSPDGRTVVFVARVGWGNGPIGGTLYSVPTDGSSEPRRLTPTWCTLSKGGPLGGICLDGSDGADTLIGTRYGDLIIGGSGNDMIRAGDGENAVEGQWGNDDVRTGSGVDYVWGGAGDDVIRSGAGRDFIYPGVGHDQVFAGSGPDVVVANDGERDLIDCGPGDDRARVDSIDVTRNCEHITIAAPAPDPPP